MSVEVKLTDEDFNQLKNWFCLAFAKKSPEDIDCNDKIGRASCRERV